MDGQTEGCPEDNVSLGIVIKGPEGVVLAGESRVTLTAQTPQGPMNVNFDNASKLLSFSGAHHRWVGAVTYGQAAIGLRTAHSFLPELENELSKEQRLKVADYAKRLTTFYQKQWTEAHPQGYLGPDMTFVVGGFNEGEPYGRVFTFDLPSKPDPVEQQPKDTDFGIVWGGQREIVESLLRGYDVRLPELAKSSGLSAEQVQNLVNACQGLQMPLPLAVMALQDLVDLAIFFIRTTITYQQLTVGIRGCGGPIDVATITRREGLKFIQRKEIVGEARTGDKPKSRSAD
jgi:hypothetical protein